MKNPKITASEWMEFNHEVTIRIIKDPLNTRVGYIFCNMFPDIEEYMVEMSNLGTPPDVYNPDDATILRGTKDPKKAMMFIKDWIDSYEILEEENV
jgi:hypothetical protein